MFRGWVAFRSKSVTTSILSLTSSFSRLDDELEAVVNRFFDDGCCAISTIAFVTMNAVKSFLFLPATLMDQQTSSA